MLNGKQRRYLRGLAHSLEPIVQLGKGGLTDGVVGAVDAALADHELIKVKLAQVAAPDRDSFETAKELYEALERVLLSHLGYEEDQIGDALGYFGVI